MGPKLHSSRTDTLFLCLIGNAGEKSIEHSDKTIVETPHMFLFLLRLFQEVLVRWKAAVGTVAGQHRSQVSLSA